MNLDLHDVEVEQIEVIEPMPRGLESLTAGHAMTELDASVVAPPTFVICSCCCCC